MLFQKIEQLASEKSNPCVTLSFNTHRTHPDNSKDSILLKNLATDAERRLLAEYDKREVAEITQKLQSVIDTVDHNYNLDSMHVFVSPSTVQVVKLAQPVDQDRVFIDQRFAIRPLIKALNETEDYQILLLSQSGARLLIAQNDAVESEIENENFPIGENPFSVHPEKVSHAADSDNRLKEYLNRIDKALVREFNESGLRTIVISTVGNHKMLMEVADRPEAYSGHVAIDYNSTSNHQLAAQAWNVIKSQIEQRKGNAINEINEAVSHGKVLTDLNEIFQAAVSGRGELLAVNANYSQPAVIVDDFNISLIDDAETPGAEDDIVSKIAWRVASAKGRVVFTESGALGELEPIVLKTRY